MLNEVPGAEVQEDIVRIKRLEVPEKPRLLREIGVGRIEEVLGAADEAQVRDAGLDDDVLDGLDTPVQKIGERHLRDADAERRVKVRAAEVGVHEQDLLLQAREGDADIAGDQAFTDPAFAAADGPDLFLAQSILDFYHPAYVLLGCGRSRRFVSADAVSSSAARSAAASSRRPLPPALPSACPSPQPGLLP